MEKFEIQFPNGTINTYCVKSLAAQNNVDVHILSTEMSFWLPTAGVMFLLHIYYINKYALFNKSLSLPA
jgi:hypothetical protein